MRKYKGARNEFFKSQINNLPGPEISVRKDVRGKVKNYPVPRNPEYDNN